MLYAALKKAIRSPKCLCRKLKTQRSLKVISYQRQKENQRVLAVQGDRALKTGCELLPIDKVPARDEYLTTLSPGTYLIGRDIEAGLFRGKAGDDIMESCYWARLSNASGDDDILANDNATGQYFVEVLPSDFALNTGCELEKAE